MGIAKNLAKASDDNVAKEGYLEDLLFDQALNYQPCVSTPNISEHHQKHVNKQNTLTTCP